MKSSGKGFTLIELVLALLIVAFAVTALLSLFISSIFLNMANSNLSVAMSHAQYALENKKKVNFLSLPVGTETWNSDTIRSKGLVPLNSETVVIVVTNSGSYEKDISLTVNWKDRGIINRSIAFQTLRTGQ